MKLLEVKQLVKRFGGKPVVNGLSFHVNPGEVVGLLGPNGAGKTTAFYMTIGLIKPDEGEVYFKEEKITHLPIHKRAKLGFGYLAQEPSIFRKLTVEENILAILEARRLNRTERRRRTDQLLAHFGLGYLAKKKAYTLSGGEKRRLEVARCLATDPALIMLDEPFSGIDPIAVAELQAMVLELRNRGIGILITDHNVREALSITDRSYILNQGVVITRGTTAEIVNDPMAIQSYLGEGFTVGDSKLSLPPASEGQVGREIPKEPPAKKFRIIKQ